MYTDNSLEFQKALDYLGYSHDTSTPHRSETNGVAERCVRKVKEGTSCALQQSGFADDWWDDAAVTFSFLSCIVDNLVGNETAYKKRFSVGYPGPVIPFGAEIRYLPITEKDKN